MRLDLTNIISILLYVCHRNELMTCLKKLQDFIFDGLVGYDATLRREANSYYETTLRLIPGACNFVVAMRTPNLTT